jgi:hypothetical protein
LSSRGLRSFESAATRGFDRTRRSFVTTTAILPTGMAADAGADGADGAGDDGGTGVGRDEAGGNGAIDPGGRIDPDGDGSSEAED